MTSRVRIEAVLFDAGGTLVRPEPSVGHVYAAEAARFGVMADPEVLNAAFGPAWRRMRPQDDGATPFHTSEAHEQAWWRVVVETVFKDVGTHSAFGARFDAYFDALYARFALADAWHIFDDVIPTLDALDERGVRCAIVSNWDSRLPRVIEALGLADRFEFVMTSAEAGWSKPHPAIFEAAVQRLELAPEAVVHVGDAIEEDLRGAESAGLRAVLLDRNGSSADQVSKIMRLTELLRHL